MANWRDIGSMSRQERRGALVVLLVVALLVCVHVTTRCTGEGQLSTDGNKAELFEAAADTAIGQMHQGKKTSKAKSRDGHKSTADSTKRHAKKPRRSSGKKQHEGAKPSRQRDIDREVPRLP